jgi:tellurite resistance protein
MADSIRITASLRIERPAEVVRQQYRDIDHHIRMNVHPDIRYQWEPAPPGHRKIRTTFRILGVPQYDVSELEDAEDGSFLIRYLEGTNAGMVLVHRFVPLGPEATQVELTADAPATLARKLLGPLFAAGARQVMRKALAEDKRDLEQGNFTAGTAAGNLELALSFMRPSAGGSASFVRPLADRSLAAKRAVLEATCLIAVADGEFDPSEVDAMGRLAQVIGASDEREWVAARARELSAIAGSDQIVTEAQRIGRALVVEGVGLEGITAAVVVALVSGGMSLGELELLRELSRVTGVPEGSLPAVVEGAERALMSAA